MVDIQENRDIQMSEHENNSIWSGRGSEEHGWSGQEEEEFRQEIHSENRSSYLGYNGVGHCNNEGFSGMRKGKARKTGKGFGDFRAVATHVVRDSPKQLIASHRAKDQAKVEQRDSPKARQEE